MNKKRKLTFQTVLIVLVLSVMWTVPVLADEDIPSTEVPATEGTQPSDETDSSVVDTPLTETPVLAEETETSDETDNSAVAPSITETPVVEEASVAVVEQLVTEAQGEGDLTILEQLPENTTLVVLDENGNPLSLATQEAAETVSSMPDPRWCPAGVVPGGVGCSPSFSSFTGTGGLLEWLLTNNPSVAGVIWVEAAYDSSNPLVNDITPIVLNGLNYSNMKNFALTVNGGWSGLNNTSVNPNDLSEFNVPFSIINWNAAVTLNNLLITNASGTGSALSVQTTGTITVNNVDVIDNSTEQGGALLDNQSGTLGNIIVTDSTFNGNNFGSNASGIDIFSKGTVTIKNITANENGQFGLYIDNTGATAAKNVIFSGSNQFMLNEQDGLRIYSKGQITLANVTAMQNGLTSSVSGSGAYLQNTTGLLGISLIGANNFSQNGWDGLRIITNGAVVLSNVTANNNGTNTSRGSATDLGGSVYDYDAYGKGAYILNWSSAPKPITLSGVNVFNNNASTGLLIDSNGAVLVYNLTANSNGCDPLKDLNDYACGGAYIFGSGVTLSGYGNFADNDGLGLGVENGYVPAISNWVGAISLSNIYAEGNGSGGVWAGNGNGTLAYNVTLSGINTFLNNNGIGLEIASLGAVGLSNLTANGNNGDGVYVFNAGSAAIKKPVTITGASIFTGNNGDGLSISSKGIITTNGITATANIGNGANLDNCWDNLVPGTCEANAALPVYVNGANYFYGNNVGLYIKSRGAITVYNLTSIANLDNGVEVNNALANSVGGINFSGYVTATGNGATGIYLLSKGAVTLVNVKSDLNSNYGAHILNYVTPATPVNVTINGVNSFNYNESTGLWIETYGAVTLSNISAIGNGSPGYADGVFIDNYLSVATLPRNITLSGTNFFNGNNGSGLAVISTGVITVNKITANFNISGSGASLENHLDKFSQSVFVTGYGVFNNNLADGLYISSNGAITLVNITANDNLNNGAILENNSITSLLTSSVGVTLSGVSYFSGNASDGLKISSDGVITLNSINASYNGQNGVEATNKLAVGGSVNKGLNLTGSNTFAGNGATGFYFDVSGSAVLSRLISSFNSDGLGSNNSEGITGFAGGSITLTCASFNNNEAAGYNLNATGLVTLKGVYTYGNGSGNFASGTPVTISRTCTLP